MGYKMTNPGIELITKMILADADLRGGYADFRISKANFDAAINDADRKDGTNAAGRGDGRIQGDDVAVILKASANAVCSAAGNFGYFCSAYKNAAISAKSLLHGIGAW